MKYDQMTVIELRRLCAARGIGNGLWRAGASKAQLIDALEKGYIDQNQQIVSSDNDHSSSSFDAVRSMIDAMAVLLEGKLRAQVDLTPVYEKISALEQAILSRPVIQVTAPERGTSQIIEEPTHKVFPDVLAAVSAGLPVMLVGPAGTGKSHLASQVAKALALPFYAQSVCAQTTRAELLGYLDATGIYRPSLFRKAFESGGVFLFDEIDAGNPNVLAVLNAALANGSMGFPDGMIAKHKDFRVIAAANTWGHGADRQYVGRQQLDAATIDRYAQIFMDYDDAMEDALCPNRQWLDYCRKIRQRAKELRIRHVVSVRAMVYGATLLSCGIPFERVVEIVLRKGLPDDQWQSLNAQ